jgi:uncharacterized protein
MHLEGTHTIKASPQAIWKVILDPETLARVTPGIKSLEATEEDKYKALSEVKLGPVSGRFTGDMQVANKVENESFVLKMKQNSRIGNVSAEGKISFSPSAENETEIVFAGDAKLSGTLARTGQRVLSGVANTLTRQFFEALEQEVTSAGERDAATAAAAQPVTEEPVQATTPEPEATPSSVQEPAIQETAAAASHSTETATATASSTKEEEGEQLKEGLKSSGFFAGIGRFFRNLFSSSN